MNCIFCQQPLNIAQTSNNGKYKSCPKCSTFNGREHVYYPCNNFGYSDKRSTENNPDGIQSWCEVCRGRNTVNGTGTLCSQINS